MPAPHRHSYRLTWYESIDVRHEHVYDHLWRARLILHGHLAKGDVVELDRTDRLVSLENRQLRDEWRRQLLRNPGLLKARFRRNFFHEYRRIAYRVAFGDPVMLRRAVAANRRLYVAIVLLPKPLREALFRAIG